MERNALIKNASTPVVLAGSGAALLLAGTALPWLKWPIIAIAGIWGLYTVLTRKGDRASGWWSLAAAGGVYVLGDFLGGAGRFAGWVLLAGAALSLISRLFRRNRET